MKNDKIRDEKLTRQILLTNDENFNKKIFEERYSNCYDVAKEPKRTKIIL